MQTTPCQYCQWPLLPEYVFCPHCGKRIGPVTVSPLSQVGIYAMSLFLPPLGLVPGIKYLLQPGAIAKRVGGVALVLTIISTIVTIWISLGIFASVSNQVQSQTQQYQSIGL